jgi:hypothetical protein
MTLVLIIEIIKAIAIVGGSAALWFALRRRTR